MERLASFGALTLTWRIHDNVSMGMLSYSDGIFTGVNNNLLEGTAWLHWTWIINKKKARARVLNRVDLYIDEHQVLQVHCYNHCLAPDVGVYTFRLVPTDENEQKETFRAGWTRHRTKKNKTPTSVRRFQFLSSPPLVAPCALEQQGPHAWDANSHPNDPRHPAE